MTPDQATALRAPFPPEKIGKLPRVTCGDCRDSRSRSCDKHPKSRCGECGGYLSTQHIHLDFVGHADLTDRLLEVDPEWTWEPFALDAHGLPALDNNGGMWIRLTVAGVTRIGYGDAAGKRGGDAVKEIIGDALRNAGMRFGVALDLWRKEPPDDHAQTERRPNRTADRVEHPRQASPGPNPVSQAQHRRMQALWKDLGYGGDANRDQRLTITAKILGLESLATSAALTADQAAVVIDRLETKKREKQEASNEG